MILLDTHILIWWIDDHPKLSQRHRQIIQERQDDGLCRNVQCWAVETKLVKHESSQFFDVLYRELPLTTADTIDLVLKTGTKSFQVAAFAILYHSNKPVFAVEC
jgi:PIN domain nuclease of toxin-antitoxin system